ncbi:hypothetical protein RFI_20553 [Reticulomyxa filosa]|uniref:Uncharacterized protein n=1 Tax=Reticulomyxa filosa TaxID=46433 RepID=X6MUK0_RETFI|nr:hypothetical protein RFI_20553 [Reticulomyxa filosa]|eukprot:ETO16785.1 hypothetical protein RFI_20553 [Reticulomyxa filosa]
MPALIGFDSANYEKKLDQLNRLLWEVSTEEQRQRINAMMMTNESNGWLLLDGMCVYRPKMWDKETSTRPTCGMLLLSLGMCDANNRWMLSQYQWLIQTRLLQHPYCKFVDLTNVPHVVSLLNGMGNRHIRSIQQSTRIGHLYTVAHKYDNRVGIVICDWNSSDKVANVANWVEHVTNNCYRLSSVLDNQTQPTQLKYQQEYLTLFYLEILKILQAKMPQIGFEYAQLSNDIYWFMPTVCTKEDVLAQERFWALANALLKQTHTINLQEVEPLFWEMKRCSYPRDIAQQLFQQDKLIWMITSNQLYFTAIDTKLIQHTKQIILEILKVLFLFYYCCLFVFKLHIHTHIPNYSICK